MFITMLEVDQMAYKLGVPSKEVLLSIYCSDLVDELSAVCEKLACLIMRG